MVRQAHHERYQAHHDRRMQFPLFFCNSTTMALYLSNTLTGRKEEFRPLSPPRVTMYVCGVTVYDDCHIGHARGAVLFDLLRRYLESDRYRYQVIHVRNITDVDDKIIDRARQEGLVMRPPLAEATRQEPGVDLKAAASAVAKRYEESFRRDFARLGLLSPTHEPRATEFIPEMVRFIEILLRKGVAYEAADGVYFSVRKLASYGKLSHQGLDELKSGSRVEPGEAKEDPLDFALWKKAKPEEPSWNSPWGPGRPGWHIECSTMATELLGEAFDIHGGGQDLIFPHHENEIAQALATGKLFARIWLHNGLLTVNAQKMSKSLGNIIRIQDVLAKHSPDVLRMFFLSAHYRSPIDFTWERFDEAAQGYDRIMDFLFKAADTQGSSQQDDLPIAKTQEKFQQAFDETGKLFFNALDDDLNTPEALASLHHFVFLGNQYYDAARGTALATERESRRACVRVIAKEVRDLAQLLGFFQTESPQVSSEVARLIEKRDEARRRRDYSTADSIRRQLVDQGYIVEDTSGKTVVRKRV